MHMMHFHTYRDMWAEKNPVASRGFFFFNSYFSTCIGGKAKAQ